MLSLYALILDFLFGIILFPSVLAVPSVGKILHDIRGTRHLKKYTIRAKLSFLAWTSLLTVLIILVFMEKFCPSVYNTTHIALILNNLNQLINTLQFYAAFQLLIAIEYLMKLGSKRKVINSLAIEGESKSDKASDGKASTPSMEELFKIGGLQPKVGASPLRGVTSRL
jgi:hypothetical protein